MAAQSTVAGLSVVIGSAIAFSWKSTDVLDMERQRAMRHSMSGKVRLRTRTTHYLHTAKSKTDRIQNGPALICFASWSCIGLVRTHKRLGRPLTLPLLINDLAGPSPQYSEGDDELVTYIKRQASPMTPDSPQQILQMQQMRHEFTGKLVPRMTENC